MRNDPEAILLALGFGGKKKSDNLERIPARFLQYSQMKGISVEEFLNRMEAAERGCGKDRYFRYFGESGNRGGGEGGNCFLVWADTRLDPGQVPAILQNKGYQRGRVPELYGNCGERMW